MGTEQTVPIFFLSSAQIPKKQPSPRMRNRSEGLDLSLFISMLTPRPPLHLTRRPAPSHAPETYQSTKPNCSAKSPQTPATAKNQTPPRVPPAHQSPIPP